MVPRGKALEATEPDLTTDPSAMCPLRQKAVETTAIQFIAGY
jgi:hypothetical protein